ncbi:MAG: hypothetical protein WB810_03895 [Candidatus Cybelea sp.]
MIAAFGLTALSNGTSFYFLSSTFYKRRRPMTSDAELPFLPYSVSVNQNVPLLRCESATVTGRRRNVAMLVTI